MARRKTTQDKARHQLDCVLVLLACLDELTEHVEPTVAAFASPNDVCRLPDEVVRIKAWLDALVTHLPSKIEEAA